jgi:hypothetical protein
VWFEHPGHTYGGFVLSFSERGMTDDHLRGSDYPWFLPLWLLQIHKLIPHHMPLIHVGFSIYKSSAPYRCTSLQSLTILNGIEILWLHRVWSHGDFKPVFNRWFSDERLRFDAAVTWWTVFSGEQYVGTVFEVRDTILHCSTLTGYCSLVSSPTKVRGFGHITALLKMILFLWIQIAHAAIIITFHAAIRKKLPLVLFNHF